MCCNGNGSRKAKPALMHLGLEVLKRTESKKMNKIRSDTVYKPFFLITKSFYH